MQRPISRVIGLAMSILSLAVTGTARAEEEGFEPVTPYRPSAANPAQLPAPGQLEAEFGGLRGRAGGATRESLPYLLKLGFTPEWGVLLGGEAHVWQRDESGRASGFGDTSLTLKRAWLIDDATAFGAEATAKFPTANERIGSGKSDTTLNMIFSRDFGPLHLDANLGATRLGAPDAGSGRTLVLLAASFSTALSDRWGATWEVDATHHAGESNGANVLAALTWSPSKKLTFDFGVSRTWRPAPGATQLFGGIVVPIARLR